MKQHFNTSKTKTHIFILILLSFLLATSGCAGLSKQFAGAKPSESAGNKTPAQEEEKEKAAAEKTASMPAISEDSPKTGDEHKNDTNVLKNDEVDKPSKDTAYRTSDELVMSTDETEGNDQANYNASTSQVKKEDLIHIAGKEDDPFDFSKKAAELPKLPEDDTDPVHLELAFDNADLYEVLDVTLYELYNVNYMIDPSIRGKVTFHLNGDYTRNGFINVLNDILQLNNLSITRGPGNIFKILRRSNSDSSGNAHVTMQASSTDAGDITRLLRLKYINVTTASKNIRTYLSKGARIVTDVYSNSIIITDTPDNIEKVTTLLAILDVPSFKGVSWQFFPLEEAEADKVLADLNKIFKKNGVYIRNGIDATIFDMIPIKSINSILVVTRDAEILKLIEEWVHIIDSAGEEETGTNVYVYFVENGTASELADILRQIYGGKSSSKKKDKTTIVAPAAGQEQGGNEPPDQQKKPIFTGELSGEIEIISDDTNNAIVFKASRRDYRIIRDVLRKLDIVPRQVLINVMVAEITLSDSLKYGVEWFLQRNKGRYAGDSTASDDGVPLEGMPPSLEMVDSTGLFFKVNDAGNFLRGLVNAIGTDSDVNILSSPTVLAVDNKEASIEVGEEIPTVTGTFTDSNSATSQTVQFKNTAISLKVTPHINSRGLIKLELLQEVSKRGEKYEIGNIQNYSFLNRKAETSLVIENGQTVVMAGLMETQKQNSDNGVPYLREIPVLGYLFKGISNETRKTELVIMITPRVINDRKDADELTLEFSRKVDRVKDLIEKKDKKK